jgi:hypothetical protein
VRRQDGQAGTDAVQLLPHLVLFSFFRIFIVIFLRMRSTDCAVDSSES